MHSKTLFASIATLTLIVVNADPVNITRRAPNVPRFVLYSDKAVAGTTGVPPASEIEGWNVFALSFLLVQDAWDKVAEWTQLNANDRAARKAEYKDAGVKLIVSAFGSTDYPTTNGDDPVAVANKFASWVKEFNVDGIDVDYEDFDAMNTGKAEQWLIDFTKELRKQLPAPDYIITHAPVAPWFTPGLQDRYPNGAYLKVHQEVGDLIDWYNIQFYNQGPNEYSNCDGLLKESSSQWPKTALFQIADSGVPLDKLVIGKLGASADGVNGYIEPTELANCVSQAADKGWKAGVMAWQYPTANKDWIAAVRSKAFPP